ncbi:MAG TPA: hypothetical protein VLT90_08770 [Terriglobales bacterium]|nr:hypothetical protein [Terriglobales bacterium]
MRPIKLAALLLSMIVFMAVFAVAGQNPMGISDTYRVSFVQSVRVADTLLPQGNYEIRHVMEGENHIMVFRQLGVRKPVEVRAKCTLVPLTEKAKDNQKIYTENAKNEWVLQELIFKGDRAKHVF